jgi:MSHA pilin protein MshA
MHAVKAGQAGFTLTELVAVTAIMGVLAAAAVPRLSALQTEARVATLNAARGAAQSAVQMAHVRYLLDPKETLVDDVQVTFQHAYPQADDLPELAGLADDRYTYRNQGGVATIRIADAPDPAHCAFDYRPAQAGKRAEFPAPVTSGC